MTAKLGPEAPSVNLISNSSEVTSCETTGQLVLVDSNSPVIVSRGARPGAYESLAIVGGLSVVDA